MPFLSDTVICFDLDDTLYKEIDFLKSAYVEVAAFAGHPEAVEQMLKWYQSGENAFKKLIDTYDLDLSINDCLKIYRDHYPNISLDKDVKDILIKMKKNGAILGIITDGRSLTQRNKIKVLALNDYFDTIIISEEIGSEKPNLENYRIVMEKYPEKKYYVYIGDNPQKDFLAPNQLGWETICLMDDGRNIHKQYFSDDKPLMPKIRIKDFIMLANLYEKFHDYR